MPKKQLPHWKVNIIVSQDCTLDGKTYWLMGIPEEGDKPTMFMFGFGWIENPTCANRSATRNGILFTAKRCRHTLEKMIPIEATFTYKELRGRTLQPHEFHVGKVYAQSLIETVKRKHKPRKHHD